MAAPVLPNTSNFLGVALVVNRLRDGPRFVFHYPDQILTDRKTRTATVPSSKDELDDDDEALLLNHLTQRSFEATSGSLPSGAGLQSWNHDDHFETESGSQIVPWEHVAGYPTRDLESLLTPSRAFHKKLFQVSLDQLCFVSSPVYVPDNGVWGKKKRQPKNKPPKSPANGESANKDVPTSSTMLAGDAPQIEIRDIVDDNATNSNSGTGNNGSDEAEEKKSGMPMFNLVFILNPKKHEANELADVLYTHIMKKINKAFKYSQQKCDFVWKESKRILTLKDKNREARTKMSVLWKEILEVSSLAACIEDIYNAVSQNKIAALQLETAQGTITHSVQIPVPFYLTDLPPEEEAANTRGLWITTANNFVEEDSLHDPSFLDKNFGLLLMSEEKKIVAELQADADADEATAAMIQFVRLSKPTMSFHQISQSSGLSPAQVRKYAQHFIFWRRGIAIPPLHMRDVYTLSPNADASLLPRASQSWSRAFPLAPHLIDFLAELSAAPRPYKWFCPSKNHRPTYLQMLAWLMRGGWVTQLCTFAYVVVWPEIIYEVEYEIEQQAEAAKREKEQQQQGQGNDMDKGKEPQHLGNQDQEDDRDHRRMHPPSPAGSSSTTRGGGGPPSISASSTTLDLTASASSAAEGPATASVGSLALRPSTTSLTDTNQPQNSEPQSPLFSEPASASTSPPAIPQTPGERFALAARLSRIADKEARESYERSAAFSRKILPIPTPHPSLNTSPHLSHLSPYIIVDARRASGRDSLYLSAIQRRFTDPRVRAAWPVLWKYFNGKTALERVALGGTLGSDGDRDDKIKFKKRKEAWALMALMSEYLVCVRHW
ncbi:hypothetical protein F5Y18DRAFT_167734 [Xylariaceae sp. FL1019]|nr:hypothetical protein F5Y18DRAFT_167734 [Xylariaceae sp. FL1019]